MDEATVPSYTLNQQIWGSNSKPWFCLGFSESSYDRSISKPHWNRPLRAALRKRREATKLTDVGMFETSAYSALNMEQKK